MKDLPPVIFLCGFSGSGKTETGRRLAEKLAYEYTDTDTTVEEAMGKSIPEIFAKLGESRFRFAETDVVRLAVSRPPRVIALGGGAIADENNLAYIKDNGFLVYLKVSAETVYARLRDSHLRPLLEVISDDEQAQQEAVMNRIQKLMAQREAHYLKADLVIDTEGRSPDEVAEQIKAALPGEDE